MTLENTHFDLEAHLQNVKSFLERAKYGIKQPDYIGFVSPHIHAEKKEGAKGSTIFGVVRKSLDEALDGLRDLVALKKLRGKDCDYLLVLPPVSEYDIIEFLTTGRCWYLDIKKEAFLIWISDIERKTITSILGWPLDESFKDWFDNPAVANFDSYIGQLLNKKMLEEEDF